MKKVLVTTKLLKLNEDRMSKLWNVKLNFNNEVYSQNKLIELSKDCDCILSSIVDKIDEITINKLSNSVKIISNFAVGFGNIDIKAAKKKNIIVTNTPDVLTDATAEIAMLLILGAARRAPEGIEWARSKNFKIAYHSACSMQHGQKIHFEPMNLIKKTGNDVIDIPDGHICCGSAGTYNMLQNEIADKLLKEKVKNIEKVKPDIISTGNIGCITQISNGTKIPILHTAELIDWYTGGPKPKILSKL